MRNDPSGVFTFAAVLHSPPCLSPQDCLPLTVLFWLTQSQTKSSSAFFSLTRREFGFSSALRLKVISLNIKLLLGAFGKNALFPLCRPSSFFDFEQRFEPRFHCFIFHLFYTIFFLIASSLCTIELI